MPGLALCMPLRTGATEFLDLRALAATNKG
jgi:hypothetical protein